MDRFRASVDALRRGEPVPEDGYRGDYVVELAARGRRPGPEDARVDRADDGALPDPLRLAGRCRASSSSACRSSCRGSTRTSKDGALWARSSAYGDEQDWVIIRSAEKGGAPTYRAADIAYLVDKLERGFDRAIYVLGADHHATARWYAAIARMLGYDPSRVEVLLYQFVHLTRGGESAKASKRAGNVVFLDDLMDEIGVDAARWYLVNRGPDQTIEIDLDLAVGEVAEEPRVLRAVRARAHRRDPPERRGRRSRRPAARRARARRRRS